MGSTSEDCDEFMEGHLVIWFKSCLDDPDIVLSYNDLVDGVLLYQVLLQIDPEPAYTGVAPSHGNLMLRVRNLEIVLKNLRSLYQDEFNQIVIMVPNVVRLGTECYSAAAKNDLNLLLLLLLACAVQCPNKEIFIERIKLLSLDVQHSIVDNIRQFTDTPLMVLGSEQESTVSHDVLLNHVRHLVKERDEFLACWANATAGEVPHVKEKVNSSISNASMSESHHLAVELADWKSKLRKQRQELEEKTEALNECKDELEAQRATEVRLRQELADILQDARSAKAYRDELDVMREKAERAEKLEVELERFKAKLRDVEFFKTRVEELREDNKVLMETREMLEGQLERSRRRGDRVMDLESEILKLKQLNNELGLERDAKDRKLEELYSEVAELQVLARCAQATDVETKLQILNASSDSGDDSLSSQLTSNATARALRLELENHRLRSTIENLKESALHESNAKLLECEHENKRMSINMEQLEEQCRRLTAENKEMEILAQDALQESRKLQESREVLRAAADTNQSEMQSLREELESVKRQREAAQEENSNLLNRLQSQEQENKEVEECKEKATLVPELSNQLAETKKMLVHNETQVVSLQKEVSRLKQLLEDTHVQQDQMTSEVEATIKERDQLNEELKSLRSVSSKLQLVEMERDDGKSRAHIAEQALEALQSELVQQKIDCQNIKNGLNRLGLNPELLLDPNVTLADLLSRPELIDQLPAELRRVEDCQQCRELANLQEELAKQQVLVTTLQSQLQSLNSKHPAVLLANKQLAVEKEQLEEQRKLERIAYEQLLRDQTSLQTLHEQLTSEHELVVQKQESLRQQLRAQQKEIQTLREAAGRQDSAQENIKAERDQLLQKAETLKNLRVEHSKLTSDFRGLFASNVQLKNEYGNMQIVYKAARAEASELQMENAKLREELTALSDSERHLQLQIEKLSQTNATLEEDRRSVMNHCSVLLSQYKELFNHSLEDNQHYHAEEKHFADRINDLRRQKEKLEEKIMDQYRKLDSTSAKKKGFGASLVRKVRKAGSELMNRSRRSLHEDSRGSINIQGSESGENESDASFDDIRQEEESGPLPRILKQQGAGTRQTVYEADMPDPGADQGGARSPGGIRVVNRLSTTTIVADRAPPSPSLSLRSQTAEDARRKRKDDIFFDYGCV